jgi:transcriptional regulator with XRE-family HTH domain
MADAVLEWGHRLAVLRALRGWSREELSAASGVSPSAIAHQEQGAVSPSTGVQEKLEDALGVAGRDPELQILGHLRAGMLSPEGRYWPKGIAEAGAAAEQIMEVALRLGLDHLERIEPEPSLEGKTPSPKVEWPILLVTLRTLRGWSQEELATASGLTPGMISKQESGRREPTMAVREKIERALGVRGRMWEIELFLGELRAAMLHPVRRSALPLPRAAREGTRRIVEVALRLGREELRSMDGELSWAGDLPPGEEE